MAAVKDMAQYFHRVLKKKSNSSIEQKSSSVSIKVDPLSNDPTDAWRKIKRTQTVYNVPVASLKTEPISKNKLRVVCISDTHGKLEQQDEVRLPDGDVLLHCGDFTMSGSLLETHQFNEFIGKFPHRHKVVIAGNHESHLDKTWRELLDTHFPTPMKTALENSAGRVQIARNEQSEHFLHCFPLFEEDSKEPRDLLSNCLYLEEEMVQIAGINIYGTPWSPQYASVAFSLPRGQDLLAKWDQIPESVDVLMTHCPPVGMGDCLSGGLHVGCVELLHTVQMRVKPKYHVFGHIHEGYGVYTDGSTTYINASTCTRKYKPINRPIVFDIDIPSGSCIEDPVKRLNCEPITIET